MKKLILGCALTSVFFTAPAMANIAQIAVAEQAFKEGDIISYATPKLKHLIKDAYRIDGQESALGSGIGCEFDEARYLGLGNGGVDWTYFKNLKIKAPRQDVVHITFHDPDGYGSTLLEFVMSGIQIEDVRIGYNENSRTPPTTTETSLKRDAGYMVATNGCVHN